MENKKDIKDIRIGYPDCCFSADDNWFRYRTGAIIIEDGCFLVVKSESSKYFYTVGGGVHMNEKSEECIVRVRFQLPVIYNPKISNLHICI